MNTEILLSRGDTITSFELPAAPKVKLDWPEANKLKINIPLGLNSEEFIKHYQDVLNGELLDHLGLAWPDSKHLGVAGQSVAIDPWGDVPIDILPKKERKNSPEIELDRPRLTIQMGQRVVDFSDACQPHLRPELFNHLVKLWSDPDYCRTVLPVGRNLLIRGCA